MTSAKLERTVGQRGKIGRYARFDEVIEQLSEKVKKSVDEGRDEDGYIIKDVQRFLDIIAAANKNLVATLVQ